MGTVMGSSTPREPVVKAGDLVEGRYRIISTLGEGGMGTVFLAEHTLIKRRVAMKILHPELATDANVIERFMNEARAAGTLGHPNIVESTDMGFTDNHVPYIVFEYLEGTLLTDEIYRVKGLPVRRAVRIAQQIASALHAAHNAGIIHRDLKSDNVFLTDKEDAADHVKVLDFGISRFLALDDEQTRKGMVMGTPEYMAPEQITAPASVDKRADIYALGVILYEMLTARRPFSNDADPRALMQRIVGNAPPPMQRLEIPHALNDLIMTKLLAKDREQRYSSMIDVEAALDPFTTRDDSRREKPIAAQAGDDIARNSEVIPRPARSIETPWPMDPVIAIGKISLPPAPRPHRPWALYAVAGAGVIVGALGLVYGMRAGKSESTPSAAVAPAPIAPPRPAAAIPAPAPAPPRAPSKVDVSLDANVPNARVTFRRRVSPVPATLQIATSDIIEIVEISAPGYRTLRYWLTFDRPTHLNARLSKGKGLEEASDKATLVALGEVAAPAAAAPVAKPTTVAASRPTPVRRKIGRTAVEPVAPTTPTSPAATDPEPKPATDEPQPSFIAPPEPAPVAPTEPAPAKQEPAPEKVEPPQPD